MVSVPVPDSAAPQGAVPAQSALTKSQLAGVCLAGLILAFALCRHFFTLPEDQFFANHDNDGYALRLIEFRDCLASGYLFPQWCSHFRGGLGSPFFNFYQSGYFYAASLVPSSLPVNWQLGIPLVAFATYGFTSLFCLLRRSCGVEPALVAAVALLAAPYAHTNLYIRGDLSEFSAMMCIPACLLALDAWWTRLSLRNVLWLGGSAAIVVCLHPAIGLVTCGTLLLGVLVKTAADRSLRTLVAGLAGLGTGAALSAVYWLPLFSHLPLVSADQAWDGTSFGGFYHYSRHLYSLRCFLGALPADLPISVSPGFPALAGAALTVVLLLLRRQQSLDVLKRHAIGLLMLFAGGLFLMTPASRWLWDHLPLLDRIQFPWRILTLVSVALAGLVGTAVGQFNSQPVRRLCTVVLLVFLGMPLVFSRSPKLFPDSYSPNAAMMVDRFFAPDIANEWLPKGAAPIPLEQVKRDAEVVACDGECQLSDFILGQNELTLSVSTTAPATVRVPHYAFPLGWRATVTDRTRPESTVPVTLERDTDGLMLLRFDTPVDGMVTVRWHTTTMKLAGAAVSGISLLAVLLLLWRTRRDRAEPAATVSLQADTNV